jgi:hypothetical protein
VGQRATPYDYRKNRHSRNPKRAWPFL